jgi:hypothetical protein
MGRWFNSAASAIDVVNLSVQRLDEIIETTVIRHREDEPKRRPEHVELGSSEQANGYDRLSVHDLRIPYLQLGS